MSSQLHATAPLLAATLLASCGDPRLAGGSGSEAGNAISIRALSTNGDPVADALVEIRPTGSTSETPAFASRTSTEGISRSILPDGDWTVVVRKNGMAYRNSILLGDSGPENDTLSDTLRPTTRLAGILDGCREMSLAAVGGGGRARCDKDGYFQFDSLPAGELPLAVGGSTLLRSMVKIEPGVNSLTFAATSSLPPVLTSLPSDSLIPWRDSSLPASIPRQSLGDDGQFSLAVRFRRAHADSTMWGIEWGDGGSNGVRIGWRGRDTMVVRLNGRTYLTIGIPLDTGLQQLGLSWDGRRMAVLRGTDSVFTLTTSTLDGRSTWNAPALASRGVSRLDWMAFKRGKLVEDWLRRLSKM